MLWWRERRGAAKQRIDNFTIACVKLCCVACIIRNYHFLFIFATTVASSFLEKYYAFISSKWSWTNNFNEIYLMSIWGKLITPWGEQTFLRNTLTSYIKSGRGVAIRNSSICNMNKKNNIFSGRTWFRMHYKVPLSLSLSLSDPEERTEQSLNYIPLTWETAPAYDMAPSPPPLTRQQREEGSQDGALQNSNCIRAQYSR